MRYVIKTLKFLLIFTLLFSIGIILLFGHRDRPLDELKSKYANNASSFVSVNGMDVHFRDEGNKADSIPIVLLHGTASSLHTFDVWTDSLKKTRRVVRMDLPGFGLTGPFPDGNYAIANYTSFLNEFLYGLGIEQCVLAGNSLGGEIAWNFALSQPEKVEKLILIDATGYSSNSKRIPIAFKLAQIPVANKLLTYITPRFMVRRSIENIYFDTSKVTDTLVERYFELILREGNRQAFVDRLNLPRAATYSRIKQITQPTLILWGAEDLLIPVENSHKFQNDLPNSTLVILKNTGHTPMEESPVESLAPVIDFLNNAN